MDKEQVGLCREIVRMLDKASFNVSAVELMQFAQKLSGFSKLIIDQEKKLKDKDLESSEVNSDKINVVKEKKQRLRSTKKESISE